MSDNKMTAENWIYVAIGWVAGAGVALFAERVIGIPAGVALIAMFLVPLLISWANDMTKAVRGH